MYGDDMTTPFITNQEVARVLFQTASLLETLECNPFRVRAYRRAALAVLFLPKQLVDYLGRQEEPPLPGVGERIRARLEELVNTGHMGSYETLLEEIGEPLASLLSLHGVGPKTAIRLTAELQLSSMEDLLEAAREGKIRELHGFGARKEAALRERAEAFLAEAA